jgi:glycosyltransferase involved in cell wall biosynthesis
MEIFVFSYNRGRYLRNCLQALRRHAPDYPVTVMDDGSDDPEVHAALQEVSDWVDVVHCRGDPTAYLGGLYGNMQRALGIAAEKGQKLALFIQDDMQVVRDLEARDEAHWQRYFEAFPAAIELATNFLKPNRRANSLDLEIDREVPVYFRDPQLSRRAHFAAVGLFNVERLAEQGWEFAASEGENERQARGLGQRLGLTPYPFMMWLPNAASSKFRRRGLLHRFAEWYRGAGFYPYTGLPQETVSWLWQRDVAELPIAKEILSPEGLDREALWLFEDATKSLKPIHRRLKKKKKRALRKHQAPSG